MPNTEEGGLEPKSLITFYPQTLFYAPSLQLPLSFSVVSQLALVNVRAEYFTAPRSAELQAAKGKKV